MPRKDWPKQNYNSPHEKRSVIFRRNNGANESQNSPLVFWRKIGGVRRSREVVIIMQSAEFLIMNYALWITHYELCIMHYKSPLSDFHQKMETKGNHGNREIMETVCQVLKNDNISLFGRNLWLNKINVFSSYLDFWMWFAIEFQSNFQRFLIII